MGIAMMGFLNKFMDAMGIDLEPEAIGDVSALISPTGWSTGQHNWAAPEGDHSSEGNLPGSLPESDSFKTLARVLRNAPGAARLDRQWMDHMPVNGLVARTRIAADYGYDEELLSYMRHTKPRRALGAILRHNLDPEQSTLGIGLKSLGALVYAQHVDNTWLSRTTEEFASSRGVDPAVIACVKSGIDLTEDSVELDGRTAAVIAVALAMSPSPSAVDAATITTVTDHLNSEEIVELAAWISVSQLQHRLSLWYNL